MPRVYASLPLSGSAEGLARDLLSGAEAAAAGRAELVVLDSGGNVGTAARVLANARRAAGDPAALAYLGDFHSSHVIETAPLLESAGMLQVAPVATFAGLGSETLVRLTPHDGVGGLAIADWLTEQEVSELLVVHDHDEAYGIPVGAMCAEAASRHGITVRIRPVWDCAESEAGDVAGAQAVLYVGVAGSGSVRLWQRLHALDPELWLLGSEGVAQPSLAAEIDPAAAARTRFWVAQHVPFAHYGHEAMALILDAIDAGGGDREATVRAARATRDRESPIGRYSIDEHGHTTSTAYGRLAIESGALVPDV
jgi:branched-chain amino acid transport system substrate-binding protein